MNQCPVCSSEIQDAFGLVECSSCHKILFADFDGTLKVHEESPAPFSEDDIPVHEINEEVSDQDFNTNWNLIKENPPSLDALDPVVEMDAGPIAVEEPIVEESTPQESLGTMEEIHQFANSPESSLKQGQLIYNLTIKNIDTEELKDEILEILKESRLGIDIKKLKFSLPTLELKDLNPVKVSVIVSRIKHLSVDLEWEQRSVLSSGENGND